MRDPEFGVGGDGNYITVGDSVRHSSCDLAIEKGERPAAPGVVESLESRFTTDGREEVWVTASYPKAVYSEREQSMWPPPRPPGGGVLTDRSQFFRKMTPEEIIAERFML